MICRALFMLTVVFISASNAHAQEFGLVAGVHQSTAESRISGASTDGMFGFRAGMTMSAILQDDFKFRSGVMFVQRHFEMKDSGETYTFKWDYLDVPALFQYNFNEMFGIFGGLNIAINMSKTISPSLGIAEAKTMSPIFTAGINLLFDNMYGFDVYYERGFDGIESRAKNVSAFGASFIYYFL